MRLFSTPSLLLLLLPLRASASHPQSSTAAPNSLVQRADTLSFIDDFVEKWKLDHPDLKAVEVSQVHASAEELKQQIVDGSPKASTPTAPASKQSRAAPPRRPFYSRIVSGKSTYGTNSTLETAREIVRLAQEEANARNKARFADPRVNNYYVNLHPSDALRARAEDSQSLKVNETVAAAAAIVAEAAAANSTDNNRSKYTVPPEISSIIEHIEHISQVPYGGSANNGYKVFRNVKDYGAVGDGKTDDTHAINKAMSEGGRCGADCSSSTIKPALVYFPSGTYLVSSPIIMYYNTQMVGNANNRPVIKAASSFVGLGVVSSDVYTGKDNGADEWYINQNNFLRQLRNFVIDMSGADMVEVAGLHWQVAQATSIQAVYFKGSSSPDKKHIGIFAENGSGGFMSQLNFQDGAVGIRCGNQQFTSNGLYFVGTKTAIDMLWDWGWTWKNLIVYNVDNAFTMTGSYKGGSVILMDSYILNTHFGLQIATPKGKTDTEKFSITLDNVRLQNVDKMVVHWTAGVLLDGGTRTIDSWVLGKVYDASNPGGLYQNGAALSAVHPQTESLFSKIDGGYYSRYKAQYEHLDANSFLSARSIAKGDGATDDSFALALVIAVALEQSRPLYVPMGSYIVTKTVHIPSGSVIVGECWAQIVAKGALFEDASNPQVLIRVGDSGDKGSIEIQDLLLTVEGPTAGVVLMEWNIAQSQQGSTAMWDTHFRIGGATGSRLQSADCPKLTGNVNKNCIAGSMMLHMTVESSGYLENVWAWVADHDLDSGPAQTQIDIYVARGILIESTGGPVWLYGTSSEHSVLYQYMIFAAENVFLGMLQTESPYFLPKPQAPAPFEHQVGIFNGDPDFESCSGSNSHCAAAWGLAIRGATNVHVFGAGMYNWFQEYTQPCVDTQDCQQRVLNIQASGNVWLYNVYTIGTVEMLNHDQDKPVLAKSNANTDEHPFTSVINAWLVASDGEGSGSDLPDDDDDGDDIDDVGIMPSCTQQFDSVDRMRGVISDIPPLCIGKYLAEIYLKNLTTALNDYDNIMGGDYKGKFKIYRNLLAEQTPVSIDKYMLDDDKSGVWHCTEQKQKLCCGQCSFITPDGFTCPTESECKNDPHKCNGGMEKLRSCPADLVEKPNVPPEVTYVLDDPDKFYKIMEDKYGVLRDWLVLEDRDVFQNAGCVYGNGDHSPEGIKKCMKDTDIFWRNFPTLKPDFEVPDPAKILEEAYGKSKQLIEDAKVAMAASKYGFIASGEIASSLALPALTMESAIENMRKIVEVANEKIEQDRKTAISGWISAVFFLIPMSGELAGAIGATTLRTIINMAGELAMIGDTIYETISDPDNALSNVLGLLMGGVSTQPFREAGRAMRDMPKRKLDKLTPHIRDEVGTMKHMQARCNLK